MIPKHKTRVGKTQRDQKSGAHSRCITNKQERADWQRNHKRESGLDDFPWHTVNGKGNRTRIAVRGKGRFKAPKYRIVTYKVDRR
jgi:hypothetical protein